MFVQNSSNSSKWRAIMLINVQRAAGSQHKQKMISFSLFYLTSWHNSIFNQKLKTIEAENP